MITESYELGREAAMDWIDQQTVARGGYGPWLDDAVEPPAPPKGLRDARQYRAGWHDAIKEVRGAYRAGRGQPDDGEEVHG